MLCDRTDCTFRAVSAARTPEREARRPPRLSRGAAARCSPHGRSALQRELCVPGAPQGCAHSPCLPTPATGTLHHVSRLPVNVLLSPTRRREPFPTGLFPSEILLRLFRVSPGLVGSLRLAALQGGTGCTEPSLLHHLPRKDTPWFLRCSAVTGKDAGAAAAGFCVERRRPLLRVAAAPSGTRGRTASASAPRALRPSAAPAGAGGAAVRATRSPFSQLSLPSSP